MIRVRIPIIPIAIFIILLLYSLNSWRHENTTGISPNLGYDNFLNHGIMENAYGYTKEAYRDYPAFWVIDASAKLFNGTNMNKFYDKVQNGAVDSFTAEHPEGHTIARMTTPAMFNYLPLPLKERNSGMVQANTMFISRSSVSKEIVRWNLLCALVKKCIAPEGASVECSKEQPSCHRYDQSSLSIVMCASRLRRGLPCLSRTATKGAFSAFIGVERDTEYKGPLPTC